MSRSSPTVRINNTKKPPFDSTERPPKADNRFERLNQIEMERLIRIEYDKGNLQQFELISIAYFERFDWDVELLKLLISTLIIHKKFILAQKYINALFIDMDEYALGYFFNGSIYYAKGNISMAKHTFRKAIKLSISPEYIEKMTGCQL
jgi:tetratricopeptide (TPR) repeat protein